MVSDSTDIGTIFLEIIKCGANLVSEFFMIFSKIFELNYLQRIPAANSLFFTVLSHIYRSNRPHHSDMGISPLRSLSIATNHVSDDAQHRLKLHDRSKSLLRDLKIVRVS